MTRINSSQTERKTSWTTQSRNPVSQRLSKVLGTNFDNEDTRQALRTLSDLYAIPTKGKEVQTSREDLDDEVGQENTEAAVPTPSVVLTETIPGELAARARKNLRRDMEIQLAEGSQKFLQALGEVDAVRFLYLFHEVDTYIDAFYVQKLRELLTHITAMRNSCDEAETQLALTNESSKLLLERAGNLRDERFVEIRISDKRCTHHPPGRRSKTRSQSSRSSWLGSL